MKIILGLIGFILALGLLGLNVAFTKLIWSHVVSSFPAKNTSKYLTLIIIFVIIYLAIGFFVTIAWFSTLRSVGLGAGIFLIIAPLSWPFFVILTMLNIADNKQMESSYRKKPNEVYEYKIQHCPEGYEKICELYYSKIILKKNADTPFAYSLLLKEIEKDNTEIMPPDIAEYLAGEAKLDDIKPFIGSSASAGQNYAGAYILQSLITYILNAENGTTVRQRAFKPKEHNNMIAEYLKYTIKGYRNSSTEVNSVSPWGMASLYATYYTYLSDGAEKQIYLMEASGIYKQLLQSASVREELYQGLYKYLSLQNSVEEVLDVLKNLNKKAVNMQCDNGFKRQSLIIEQYSYSYGYWHKTRASGYFYYRYQDEPVRMLDISLPDFHPFYTVEVFEKLINTIEDKDIRIKAAPYLLEAVYLGDNSSYTTSIFEEAMQKRYKQDNEPRWLDLIDEFKILVSENEK